ncbi:hypothetical protein C6496_20515 [Candidatus Poribacteria bacterium]|nr:MAG: hypothetical protein C6496_20515 [Candidatus Poribacteria bacterium]
MKLNPFVYTSFIVVLLLLLCINRAATSAPVEAELKSARKQFYAAIKDKTRIEPAIKLFKQIARMKPRYAGRTQVYIGALVALKGKHAFFPHAKLKWTKRGLAIMDNGLKKNPTDLEALFIHGTTCYYLPFFFRRSDDAQRDFKEIIKQMPLEVHTYDPNLIIHIVAFLLENAELASNKKTYLQALKSKLELQRPIVDQ